MKRCASAATADSLPGADDDYFRDMDYGATKDPAALARDLAPYLPGVTPEQALKAAVIGATIGSSGPAETTGCGTP